MKALVCGSFDPVTNGHIDLIKRAAKMFDTVTVGIFINSGKKYMFSEEERYNMLKMALDKLKNVEIDISSGLVASYVKEHGIGVIVKGVRNVMDYEYELNMARINKELAPNTETVFLPATSATESISSSLVKTLFLSGEDVSKYVPECVLEALNKKR